MKRFDERRREPGAMAAGSGMRAMVQDGCGRMLPDGATLVELAPMEPERRTSAPLASHSFVYELKLRGMRVRALVDHGNVELRCAEGSDCSDDMPEVVQALARLPGGPHVLDGRCCEQGQLAAETPAEADAAARLFRRRDTMFCVFDLLYEGGARITALPLLERKERLQSLIPPDLHSVLYVSHFENDARPLWGYVAQLGLEGIVAKRKDAPYLVNARSDHWRVLRPPRT